MRYNSIKSLLLFASVWCCLPLFSQSTLPGHWQVFIDSIQKSRDITGVLIHVEAPTHSISWTSATGVDDLNTQHKLSGHEPVRIASITKSFVATGILRLWEDKKLASQDPITKYISNDHARLLREGGYEPENMTIGHLLSHTSGLFDHGSSQQFIERVMAEPQHRWTRTEQIHSSMIWGKPVGNPGERYSYSDTGYLLLGEISEAITGQSLGNALRELIDYDAIGLDETWFEITEEQPKNTSPRAHQYLGSTDTYDFHPSLDLYGGGGIVTTMQDLTEFYNALFDHRIYAHTSTLDTMLAPVKKSSTEKPRHDYRKGIWLQPYDGFEAWTHSGFWGVQVLYIPEIDAAVAIAVIRQDDFGVGKEVLERVVTGLFDNRRK